MRSSFLEVNLRSGKQIFLGCFHVTLTYSCLLEGRIVPQINELALSSAKVTSKHVFPGLPRMLVNEAEMRRRIQSVLPELLIVGEFALYDANPATGEMPRTFAAAWFQDELEPIMSAENLEELKKIDFEHVLGAPKSSAPKPKQSWMKRLFS